MPGSTYAVLIAIERYQQSTIHGVSFAVADAEAMRDVLIQQMGVPPENIKLWVNEEATRTTFEEYLKYEISTLGPDDRFIFFYAGHGFFANGSNRLTMWETSTTNLATTTVCLDQVLLSPLKSGLCRKSLVFIDACASTFGDADTLGRRVLEDMKDEEFVELIQTSEYCAAFFSSSPGQQSYPSRKVQHGIWTYQLLRALKGEDERAFEHDRYITGRSLQNYLRVSVREFVAKNTSLTTIQQPYALCASNGEFEILNVPENSVIESLEPASTTKVACVRVKELIERADVVFGDAAGNGLRGKAVGVLLNNLGRHLLESVIVSLETLDGKPAEYMFRSPLKVSGQRDKYSGIILPGSYIIFDILMEGTSKAGNHQVDGVFLVSELDVMPPPPIFVDDADHELTFRVDGRAQQPFRFTLIRKNGGYELNNSNSPAERTEPALVVSTPTFIATTRGARPTPSEVAAAEQAYLEQRKHLLDTAILKKIYDLPRWRIWTRPLDFRTARFQDLDHCEEFLETSSVRLDGIWPKYPQFNKVLERGEESIGSETDRHTDFVEQTSRWVLFQSGQFVHHMAFDRVKPLGKLIHVLEILDVSTAVYEFVARMVDERIFSNFVGITFDLIGVGGRKLSWRDDLKFKGWCQDRDFTVYNTYTADELSEQSRKLALDAALTIYAHFGWDHPVRGELEAAQIQRFGPP